MVLRCELDRNDTFLVILSLLIFAFVVISEALSSGNLTVKQFFQPKMLTLKENVHESWLR